MNKKGNLKIGVIIAVLALALFIAIIVAKYTGLVTKGDENSYNKKLPIEIANLKNFSSENLNSYQTYMQFAQSTNDLITVLNNQKIFNIPKLKISEESHQKILKFITEYGPLIDNYNQVVLSAKQYNSTRLDKDLEYFYGKASNFALELTLISSAVFYTPSYESVGAVYRASGLQFIAPRCGGCVSVALSTAHWTVRNGLVELSSQFVRTIEENPKNRLDSISIDSLKEKGESILDNTSSFIGNTTNKTITTVQNYNYTKSKDNVINRTKNVMGGIKDFGNKIF